MKTQKKTLWIAFFALGLLGGIVTATYFPFNPASLAASSTNSSEAHAPTNASGSQPASSKSTATSDAADASPSSGDPVNDLLALIDEKNPLKRAALEYAAVDKLDAAGVDAALNQLAKMPQARYQTELEALLLKKIAKSDPAKALNFASSLPNAAAAQALSKDLFSDWFKQSSDAAWKWATQLPPGLGRNLLLKEGLAAMANNDPKSTATYILQLAAQPGSESLYKDAAVLVARQLLKKDRDTLNNFMASLPDGAPKTAVVCAVAFDLRRTESKTAADLLLASEQNMDVVNTMTSVMDNWGDKDLPAALAYAQTLKGEESANAMRFLIAKVAKTDLPTALDMLAKENNPYVTESSMVKLVDTLDVKNTQQATNIAAQIPDGPAKNAFLNAYTYRLSIADPQTAAQLASNIADPKTRNASISNVYRVWEAKDSSAAQNWLSGAANIDPALKQSLLGHP